MWDRHLSPESSRFWRPAVPYCYYNIKHSAFKMGTAVQMTEIGESWLCPLLRLEAHLGWAQKEVEDTDVTPSITRRSRHKILFFDKMNIVFCQRLIIDFIFWNSVFIHYCLFISRLDWKTNDLLFSVGLFFVLFFRLYSMNYSLYGREECFLFCYCY